MNVLDNSQGEQILDGEREGGRGRERREEREREGGREEEGGRELVDVHSRVRTLRIE